MKPANMDQTPKQNLQESLSALMDDEAGELELRRLLRELQDEPSELLATWNRYHLVRAGLRRDLPVRPTTNLLAGVNERLAGEAIPQPGKNAAGSDTSPSPPGMLRMLAQGAIAASVALAVLVGVATMQGAGQQEASGNQADLIAAEAPLLNGDFNAGELARSAVSDAEALERIERAVLQEFSDLPEPQELPVSYNPDFLPEPRTSD